MSFHFLDPEAFLAFRPGDFTFAMIKPDGHAHHRKDILAMIKERGFHIERIQEVKLTQTDVEILYYHHLDKHHFATNAAFITSGPVTIMMLCGVDIVNEWRAMMGAIDSAKAHGDTIRGRFGNKTVLNQNVVHGADSPLAAFREAMYFFGKQRNSEAI